MNTITRQRATHAYIGIYDGTCRAIAVDLGDIDTADWIADVIIGGGCVERVPIDVAQEALFKAWPAQFRNHCLASQRRLSDAVPS